MTENKKYNLEPYQNPLMDYLPDYYDISPEEHYINFALTPEVQSLWEGLAQVKAKQFILTADSATLRKWERLLRLAPVETRIDLDYRRTVIIIKLSTRAPLTYRWLIEKLDQTVGVGNSYTELYPNEYALLISLKNDGIRLYTELKRYFREIIPANLILFMATEMDQEEPCFLYIGGGAFPGITKDTLPPMAEDYCFKDELRIRSGLLPGYGITRLPEMTCLNQHKTRLFVSSRVYTLTSTVLTENMN